METRSNESSADFLVVDDDGVFRTRLVRALTDRGFSVLDCGCVDDAIQILRTQRVARALVDLKMPQRNGLELIEFLSEHRSDCAAVVLTGYGSIATALTAVKLGAKSYLTKPISFHQILEAFDVSPPNTAQVSIPSLPQVEWDHLHRVVADCNGNISQAAKLLGLHRRSLQRKLQKAPKNLV